MGNLFNETVAETICNSEKIIYIQNKKHSESKADMVRKKKKKGKKKEIVGDIVKPRSQKTQNCKENMYQLM